MILILHPDPGVGAHWRLTLKVSGVELSADVANRNHPSRRRPPDETRLAVHEATSVATELFGPHGFTCRHDGDSWTWSKP